MALTKIIGSGIGTVADNVVITSDDPTITMTDSSGTNDISTLQSTSGALIITVRDGTSDGEIIFKGDTGSAVTEHARIANTGLMTVISEGNAVQTSVQQGLVKCWYLDSEGGSSLDSFNVASNTDNSTGNYTKGFTNNFSNDNFSAVSACAQNTSFFVINSDRSVSSGGSVTTVNVRHDNAAIDGRQACNICGDLA